MGKHFAAVDPLPGERVMIRLVELVPRQLLREESRDAREVHDLRQLAVVSEHVGVPEFFAANAELALEISLAEEELPAERFARWNVAIRFDPRSADDNPLAFLDRLLNAAE